MLKKELQGLVAEVGKMVAHERGPPAMDPPHIVDENLLAVQRHLERILESLKEAKEEAIASDRPASGL